MKNNKITIWGGSALAIMGMSLSHMPYPIIFITFSLTIITFFYYIIKENAKKGWTYFGVLISIFMSYIFLFISRIIEEFKILVFMEKPFFLIGVFFIVIGIAFGYMLSRTEIKRARGICKCYGIAAARILVVDEDYFLGCDINFNI